MQAQICGKKHNCSEIHVIHHPISVQVAPTRVVYIQNLGGKKDHLKGIYGFRPVIATTDSETSITMRPLFKNRVMMRKEMLRFTSKNNVEK